MVHGMQAEETSLMNVLILKSLYCWFRVPQSQLNCVRSELFFFLCGGLDLPSCALIALQEAKHAIT